MWIFITLFAAGCQSMRTAYQNTLAREAGFLHATLSRSLFGLPLVSAYLVLCWQLFGWVSVEKSLVFWLAATICAIAQVMATYFMLRAFQSSSFALGTLLSKTEAVLAALIGLPLLHYTLTFGAWLGIAFGVLGAVVMSVKWKNIRQVHKDASLLFGLGSGLCFAITSVTASIASHALSGSLITSAGVTLCYVLALQSIILCSIQMVKSKDVLAPFRYELVLSCKVGMLSALGSIGWFTGFALVNPALVKTLGQIEIVGTLYYSKVRFAEKMTKQQWIGGAMIVISVVLVVTSTLK
ncbi:multidrug transporter [Marinomonas primoryensis]|uniref:Multidrug transporter n=1 Tax=Marinomonas primoryensis TaxID=178399 RepID=A0A2Z4PUH3_9GAMM|nr:DMT family transporter [Marinomonas primoryensis]AWY01191.1 multidrug transporter [Marinomonas primoryensis]